MRRSIFLLTVISVFTLVSSYAYVFKRPAGYDMEELFPQRMESTSKRGLGRALDILKKKSLEDRNTYQTDYYSWPRNRYGDVRKRIEFKKRQFIGDNGDEDRELSMIFDPSTNNIPYYRQYSSEDSSSSEDTELPLDPQQLSNTDLHNLLVKLKAQTDAVEQKAAEENSDGDDESDETSETDSEISDKEEDEIDEDHSKELAKWLLDRYGDQIIQGIGQKKRKRQPEIFEPVSDSDEDEEQEESQWHDDSSDEDDDDDDDENDSDSDEQMDDAVDTLKSIEENAIGETLALFEEAKERGYTNENDPNLREEFDRIQLVYNIEKVLGAIGSDSDDSSETSEEDEDDREDEIDGQRRGRGRWIE